MSVDAIEGRMVSGTMRLSDLTTKTVVLQPTPSNDPQDPLNWSRWRKATNFGLVLFYVLMTFVLLDISGVSYNDYVEEFGMTYDDYNNITAANYAGLAVGCVLFIPLVYKFGRRPIYLASLAIQLATAIWSAKTKTIAEMIALNVIQGLGGAISETIVQITIADIFFVHQYATMNGLFLLFQAVGAYLGPVAAGYVVVSQGWRWEWWWCAIFLGVSLVLVLFLFEETAYVAPILEGEPSNLEAGNRPVSGQGTATRPKEELDITKQESTSDVLIKMHRPWHDRLRLYTKTEVSIIHHVWQPFVLLVRIPAVAYVALTYGLLLASFAAIVSVSSAWLFYEPYNFDAGAVGLFNIAPFVGTLLASVLVALLSDRWIIRLAEKNGGIYEAEMRLWPAIPMSLLTCAGCLMFGFGIARGESWVLLALGEGLFGFGFTGTADIALSYLTDSYQNLIGDAVVGVIFVRNVLSIIISFTLTPWINGMGLQYMFLLLALITLSVLLGFPVVLLIYGKGFRQSTQPIIEKYSRRQPPSRRV